MDYTITILHIGPAVLLTKVQSGQWRIPERKKACLKKKTAVPNKSSFIWSDTCNIHRYFMYILVPKYDLYFSFHRDITLDCLRYEYT